MGTPFKKFHLHWGNIVKYCHSQNKSLLSFSLKIHIPVMWIFVNCSSWKAKIKKKKKQAVMSFGDEELTIVIRASYFSPCIHLPPYSLLQTSTKN